MANKLLSEELAWRGFINQTTFDDIKQLDDAKRTFYLGVDPSADSMQIGNFAIIMFVRRMVQHGHKAVLLVGGATGLIGDPDGKADERNLKTYEEIGNNKQKLAEQFSLLLQGADFEIVDNYDWFKNMSYLNFLRDVGKHVPMRQMLGRDFVQQRLGENGAGISYAEFSYSLIQGYDFVHLFKDKNVTLQICGGDQWGNSIAGVDLVRRIHGAEVHVLSAPLIVNKSTGVKFGKTEGGAVWLDPTKTTPTQFYQFWINVADEEIEHFLKIYTDYDESNIKDIIEKHDNNPSERYGQQKLAKAVTAIVHGVANTELAIEVTSVLTGLKAVGGVDDLVLNAIRKEIPAVTVGSDNSLTQILVDSGLASSNTEARRLVSGNAISVNNVKTTSDILNIEDFNNNVLIIRKGKKFKDSALVEFK